MDAATKERLKKFERAYPRKCAYFAGDLRTPIIDGLDEDVAGAPA